MPNKLRIAAVVVAALVLAVGSWIAYDKYSRRNHVVTMVKDAATRLHTLLQAESGVAPQIDREAHATAIEGYVSTLRKMNTRSFTPLADAADDYLLTAREIARRAVDVERSRKALESSTGELAAHLKNDRGEGAWIGEAVRLKQTLDRDFREYRLHLDAYRKLLETLAASQSQVVPYVEGVPMIEDTLVRTAAATALDAYAAAEQNVKQVADLGSYAVRR